MQITSAMKMVSAAKLKKAQDAITAMRPYSEKLTELLQNLSATLDADTGSKYSDQREPNKVLVVAITSNRGLAGAFNSNIVKEARNLAANTYAGKQVDFMTLGKKGNDILKKTGTVLENNNSIFDDLSFENTAEIAQKLKDADKDFIFDESEADLNKFDKIIDEVEPGSLRLPVLIKKYIKQNAKVVAFNVDPLFNNAVDGLMYIRIADLPESTVKPVMEEFQAELEKKYSDAQGADK